MTSLVLYEFVFFLLLEVTAVGRILTRYVPSWPQIAAFLHTSVTPESVDYRSGKCVEFKRIN